MSRAPGSRRKGAARVFNTDRASEACESNLPHTSQLHGPCKREVVPHGSAARIVFVVSAQHGACSRGVCADFQCSTGRAAQHGPCPLFGLHGSRKASARGVFTRRANPIFRTRGLSTDRAKEAARVLVGFVRACQAYFQHGACDLARVTLGSARVTFASTRVKLGFARVVQFSFF